MEAYNLFTPEGRLRVTKIASVLVFVLLAFVFLAGSFLDAQRLETRQCPVHKLEKIPRKNLAWMETREFNFHQYTDPYRKEAESNNTVEEIAVLFLAERQEANDFRSLISIVSERAQDASFLFHWYCADFNRYKTLYSYGTTLKQYEFVRDVLKVMKNTHPEAKIVVIANEFNGIPSILIPLAKRDDERERLFLPEVDLLVFGLTTIEREHVESEVDIFELSAIYNWEGEEPRIPTGVVSIDSGEQNTYYPLQNVIHVPAWTIDNVPDKGISGSEALSCTPYLLHISDLLFEYGRRNSSQQTGKMFVKSFYQDFEKNKSAHLPSNWKKDTIGGALTISTGGSYILSTESSEWIMVDLRQSESIWIDINGSCLKSATVIRQKKFISRKEDLINGTRLEFGIFKVNKFEDVRVFVESNGKCDLTINTSSSWHLYFDKFNSVLDGNYYFVGALITSTLLFILESDTRSFRVNQQLTCYVVFIIGVGVVAFTEDMLFFHERSSLFLGFGTALAVHFVCALLDKIWIKKAKRSFDSYFVEEKAFLKSNHHVVILLIIATHYFSSIYCMTFLFLLVITSTRNFLPTMMLLPTFPLWTRALNFNRIIIEYEYRHQWQKVSLSYLKNWLLLAIGVHEIVCYAYRYYTAPKNPNTKRPARRFNQLSRYQLRCIYIPIFLLQLVFAHAPLERHFVATIFLLYLNMFAEQHIPAEQSKPVLNESKLNEQCDAQGKEKKKNKKKR